MLSENTRESGSSSVMAEARVETKHMPGKIGRLSLPASVGPQTRLAQLSVIATEYGADGASRYDLASFGAAAYREF